MNITSTERETSPRKRPSVNVESQSDRDHVTDSESDANRTTTTTAARRKKKKKKKKRSRTVSETEAEKRKSDYAKYHRKYLGIDGNEAQGTRVDEPEVKNYFSLKETYNFEVDVGKLSQEIWAKKRCLSRYADYFPLPRKVYGEPEWQVPELQERKTELNETKSLLDKFPLNDWHLHTKIMNTAGSVIPTVRSEIGPEYCSQAWCKMFECLSNFEVIPKGVVAAATQPNCEMPFNTVHLCEAPGAFISATNHYIRTNYPQIKWDWLATTLNPYYEGNDVGSMINEDKLIISSMNSWTFLKDGTGNIMKKENLDFLVEQVKAKFSFTAKSGFPFIGLVTADGSIDCQANPMEQEATVAPLHFAEIVAALHILGTGGTFVLKLFTFLECQTINHLYILASAFREIHLYKPATSKEGNSEVYAVCLKYMGRDYCDILIKKLRDAMTEDGYAIIGHKQSLLSHKLLTQGANTRRFLGRIIDAAMFFTGCQMAIIKRNVRAYANHDDRQMIYFQHDIIKREVADMWLEKYSIKVLPPQCSLFRLRYSKTMKTHVDPRTEIGCFLDKVNRLKADSWTKVADIRKHLPYYYRKYGCGPWSVSELKGTCQKLSLVRGLPYDNIRSSRFCFGRLLQERHEIREAGKPFVVRANLQMNSSTRRSCDCRNRSHVYRFISVLPDVDNHMERWDVKSLCFRESSYELFCQTDMQSTYQCLSKILLTLCELKRDQSLFLCRYPLLSRLHVGFIYALSAVFEVAILGVGGYTGNGKLPSCPRGILLHRYAEISTPGQQEIVCRLTQVVKSLKDDNKDETTLEIVPIEVLAQLPNFNNIMTYNLLTTAEHLDDIITEMKKWLPHPPNSNPSTSAAANVNTNGTNMLHLLQNAPVHFGTSTSHTKYNGNEIRYDYF